MADEAKPDDFQARQERASRAPAAKYANRSYARVNGGFLRVAFGEELVQGDPRYHTAVMLTLEDARELAFLMYDLVETEMERQQQLKTEELFEDIRLPTATDEEAENAKR